jgi:hypothetical protein
MDAEKIEVIIRIGTTLFHVGFAAWKEIVDFARNAGLDNAKIAELKLKYDALEATVAARAQDSPNPPGI